MNEVVPIEVGNARRLTERIRIMAMTVSENFDKLKALVAEARESDVHTALGYPSWTAYITDVLSATPLVLERDMRRELVAELAEQGMSSRAIAPIVGVSDRQVRNDMQVGTDFPPDDSGMLQPDGEATAPVETPIPPGAVVNNITGEVVEGPVTTEHTITEKTKTVIGLDGKTYTQKPREPKPVATGEDAEQKNAEELCFAFGRSLVNLEGLTYPQHRERIIRDWPRGRLAATPDAQELANPLSLRVLAEALNQLAGEWENSNV